MNIPEAEKLGESVMISMKSVAECRDQLERYERQIKSLEGKREAAVEGLADAWSRHAVAVQDAHLFMTQHEAAEAKA